jgi:hypothetical protein
MEPLIVVLGVLGAISVHLIASETYVRASWLARTLIKRAARHLSEPMQRRYEEEWLAHLDHCAGNLAKLLHGAGCYVCAWKLRQVSSAQRVPTAADIRVFHVEGKSFYLDVSTAAYVLKTFRTAYNGSAPSQIVRALSNLIEALEEEFVLSDPDPGNLKEFAAAFNEMVKKLAKPIASDTEMNSTST